VKDVVDTKGFGGIIEDFKRGYTENVE